MKTFFCFTAGCVGAVLWLNAAPVFAQDTSSETRPEVWVTAPSWKTAEPCPVCLVAPGVLRFERTEAGPEPLAVYLAADGTATPGMDYQELPAKVEIPAGESFTEIYLAPLDDEQVEGPEVARVRLLPRPELYHLRPGLAEALVVIGDIEFGVGDIPQARLDIIQPKDGSLFRADTMVKLDAVVVWTEGEITQPVSFFAGDHVIGRSPGVPVLRPPIPGLPSVQAIFWTNPPVGDQVLSARVEWPEHDALKSPPVRISFIPNDPPEPTVVSLEVTSPIAEETSYPYRRLRFDGRLVVRRTGSLKQSLPVYLHYGGTAAADDFDPSLPWLISIPMGAEATEVIISAAPDEIEEGIETLEVRLANCPPDREPALGAPCYEFAIDPARASGTVFVRDDGITRADVVIEHPEDGAVFRSGSVIVVEAVAIDLQGYISRLEFFDGDRSIGVSEIVFVRAPDPGTPIHHRLEWAGAAPGEHILTARARVAEASSIVSDPVRILVDHGENQPPRVSIVHPESGAVFPPLTPIEIVAVAGDPDGLVRKVVFFANERPIGEVGWSRESARDAVEPQRFAFLWRYPWPGSQVLRAVAVDQDGARAGSEPVEIRVQYLEDRPIIAVRARDPFAVEPVEHAEVNTATFVVRRFGGAGGEVDVRYSVGGSAENGVDYERLSGRVHFGPEQDAALLVVRPLPDDASEGAETVLIRLQESDATNLDATVPGYQIGYRGRAVAVIQDADWSGPEGRHAFCLPLGDQIMHVCFGAEDGRHYRIDGSTDMDVWETLHDDTASHGVIHYVDEEAGIFPYRYYRLVPDEERLAE